MLNLIPLIYYTVCAYSLPHIYIGDATTVPHMMNYSSGGFMMAGGSLTMPHQPITTMHNPSYLSPLPPSSVRNTVKVAY